MSGPELVRQSEEERQLSGKSVTFSRNVRWLLFPLTVITVILSLPIKVVGWIFLKIRTANVKINQNSRCPACGWKKHSRMNCIETHGPERAAIEITCGRCGAKFYLALLRKAELWMAKQTLQDQAAKIKAAASRTVL